MMWLDTLIKISAAVAGGLALWKIVVAVVHAADAMQETRDCVKTNLKNVESIPEIQRHCRENYLTNLRLTIMSKEMPLGERVAAGKEYLKEGGNGDVKKYLINELHINEVQEE